MTTIGKRFNNGKMPLNFILTAPNALNQLAAVMSAGEAKYDRDNWKKGLIFEEIQDSFLRHLVALVEGKPIDEETGLPHTAHLLCNAFFLAELAGEGNLFSVTGEDLSGLCSTKQELLDALKSFKETLSKEKANAKRRSKRA